MVRTPIDWKQSLELNVSGSGIDSPKFHQFRDRLMAGLRSADGWFPPVCL
jgi:hypothetical protein